MKLLILGLLLACAASSARAALTPDEQRVAQSLSPDARTRYTDTRNYVHMAQAVANGNLDPLQFGRRPKDYDASYVTGGELIEISNALSLSNAAMLNGIVIV